jgi:hypothetical protein
MLQLYHGLQGQFSQLLLIFAAKLELATRQVDYTAAFVLANVDTPPGFDKMSLEDQY